MKILLTGGTGFFGKSLLRYWMERKNKGFNVPTVTVLSRSPQDFLKKYTEFKDIKWLTFHEGDILNKKSLPTKDKYTHLLHAAADSTNGPKLTSLQRYIQIVDGTRNLLDHSINNEIRRILFISSGAVYGPQPVNIEKIPENYNGMPDPLLVSNTYGVAKRNAEHLCTLYQAEYGLDIVIARCFAFGGIDLPLKSHFALGNFVNDAIENNSIIINGNGEQFRSYLDQRDLANWLEIILTEGTAGEAYNVGSDNSISITELAIRVKNLIAPSKEIIYKNEENINNTRNRYIPCIEKARKELNLNIKYSIDEIIKSMNKIK